MGRINWVRVLLCGIVTGGIAFLLNLVVFVFALQGTEIAAVVDRAGGLPPGPLVAALYLAVGIWTMWLYAAIRPRYGPGPKTAAFAGLALWVIAVLADLIWVSSKLTVLSYSALVFPVAAALPIVIVATLAGAWLYKE